MLFYMGISGDFCPLLVDATDEAHARKMAAEVAPEKVVARVVPIHPGVFVAELFGEDEDGNEVEILPLDHVVDLLDRIDSIDTDPAPELALAFCGKEAEADGGEVVRCELQPSHGPEHEGVTNDGRLMRWTA
jgi:hypothetical protein